LVVLDHGLCNGLHLCLASACSSSASSSSAACTNGVYVHIVVVLIILKIVVVVIFVVVEIEVVERRTLSMTAFTAWVAEHDKVMDGFVCGAVLDCTDCFVHGHVELDPGGEVSFV
jgi:hypothetical protein